MKKLSLTGMLKDQMLRRQWEVASDAERAIIEQRRAALRRESATSPKTRTEEKDANAPSSQGPKKKPAVPPLEKLPHGLYCEYVELMPMVKVEGKWMSYETYRETPGRNIFDLDPNDVDIMYLNQQDYADLEAEALSKPQSAVSKCVHKLPKAVEPVAISIINGLLFMEAQYDARIKKLGCYQGEVMYDFEQLYADFFNGVIYNVLHNKMTLEEARHFAETDEMPEAEESGQSTEGTEPEKDAKPEEGTGTSQPAAAQSQSTTKSTSKDSAKKPKKPAPVKSNQDHIRDLL